MSMPDELTLLLTLTRRLNAKGDDLIQQAQKLYAEHAREVVSLREMWEEIGDRLEMEERRFAAYMPKQVRDAREAPAREAAPAGQSQTPRLPQGGAMVEASAEKKSTLAEAMRRAAASMGSQQGYAPTPPTTNSGG